MSVYASGELPMVGDLVERVKEIVHDIKVGERAIVERIVNSWSIIIRGQSYDIVTFKLIRRADSPGTWIAGPPPKSCTNAVVICPQSSTQPIVTRSPLGTWNETITHHIPIEVPPPPPAPIPLPRRFRAKYRGKTVVGCVYPDGTGHVKNADSTFETWHCGPCNMMANSLLTDITYIDE